MRKGQTEPFTEFAKLGRGVPMLRYYQNPKTAHVYWGDGRLWDYVEFSSALDKTAMQHDLHEAFQRHVRAGTIKNNRPCLAYGSVHGHLSYGPTPLAVEIRDIVRGHFSRALEQVADRVRNNKLVDWSAGSGPPEAA